MRPVVGIVGRPNVGKSTLFNRLLGYRKAITEDSPGVTRDRNYGEVAYNRRAFVVVDTGGFEPSSAEGYFPLIRRQIEASVEEAALLLLVVDANAGLLPEDMEILRRLRRYDKRVLCVVNKVDSQKAELKAGEFFELGADGLYTISALHGTGIAELLDAVIACLPAPGTEAPSSPGYVAAVKGEEGQNKVTRGDEVRIALVGRPNTGKSSLANRLLGLERMIVSDVPGTTRDAIDSRIDYGGREIVLIDTAGLRRKSRISLKVEEYSVSSAVKTVERADVVNLVLDASEGASHQDGAITHLIMSRGKGLLIVVNKWDLLAGSLSEEECRRLVRERIPHAEHVPVIFVSAKTGKDVDLILRKDLTVYSQLRRRIATAGLNSAFREVFEGFPVPRSKGREVKILYAHQAKTTPPTFVLFANHPELVPEHYRRYIENSLRERFGFQGVPIRLVLKKK